MEVNGFPLPAALDQTLREGKTEWMPKEWAAPVDAYGNKMDIDILEMLKDAEAISERISALPIKFNKPEYASEEVDPFAHRPGFIPYIHDFSRIIPFGKLASGELFALDYRDSQPAPSVIFWDDAYWRRVAPSFHAFMQLFEPFDLDKWLERPVEG